MGRMQNAINVARAKEAYEKAMPLFRSGDFKGAIPYLIESATLGDSRAQAALSNCYGNGKGVPQNDEESYRWANASAQQGNPFGLYQVGIHFLFGSHVIPDNLIACLLFRESASKGCADGMAYYGMCLALGLGCIKDTVQANQWIEKAVAEGSNAGRHFKDGNMYSLEEIEKTRLKMRNR